MEQDLHIGVVVERREFQRAFSKTRLRRIVERAGGELVDQRGIVLRFRMTLARGAQELRRGQLILASQGVRPRDWRKHLLGIDDAL